MGDPAFRVYHTKCRRLALNVPTLLAVLVTSVLLVMGADQVGRSLYIFPTTAAVLTSKAVAVTLTSTTQASARPLSSPRPATDYRRESESLATRERENGAAPNAIPATANEGGGRALKGGRAPVRRLGPIRNLLTTLAQYLFNAEARRSLKRLGHKMVETVKGVPTVDFELSYYQDKDTCLTAVDFAGEFDGLGRVPADTVKMKYLPTQHRGVIEYDEHRRSSIQIFKTSQRHKQVFLLPTGCVGTTNSTWVPLCTTVEPPCFLGRIDLHTSKADPEEPLVPLQPVSGDEFKEKLVADGWQWSSIKDLFEGVPEYVKPLTMMWDNDQCVMHAYFETNSLEKTRYSWMKSRQAFQIHMEHVDGKLYRKVSGFPAFCGGREAKDFIVTVRRLEPEGNYKALMLTQVYGERIMDDPEEVIVKQGQPLFPLDDWDPAEDEIEFTELFPEQSVKPLVQLEFGPYE